MRKKDNTLIVFLGLIPWLACASENTPALEQLPDLSHLSHLIHSETGASPEEKPDDTLFPVQAPIDSNPLTRVLHSWFETAEAVAGLDVPKGETYEENLSKSFNRSVSNLTGIIGETIDDGLRMTDALALESRGYVKNTDVLQCSGDLPLQYLEDLGGALGLSQLKHIWIQTHGTTYGMPFTLNHTYLGGASMIDSPDDFQPVFTDTPDVSCTPIYQPASISQEQFSQNFQCIAEHVAHIDGTESEAASFLDYSVFQHNCLAASRFLVECSGGEIAQIPNLDVGGHFAWDYPIQQSRLSPELSDIHRRLYSVLKKLDADAMQTQAPLDTPSSSQSSSDYKNFIDQNSSLIEEWRVALQDWLQTRGGQQNSTHFLQKYAYTTHDSSQFIHYVSQWGWTSLFHGIKRLESDLTLYDFESSTMTPLTMGALCNRARTQCGMPERQSR